MNHFDFEKLDVYQASIEVVRGRAYLTDQLQRAGTSISLNIAEGSGGLGHGLVLDRGLSKLQIQRTCFNQHTQQNDDCPS